MDCKRVPSFLGGPLPVQEAERSRALEPGQLPKMAEELERLLKVPEEPDSLERVGSRGPHLLGDGGIGARPVAGLWAFAAKAP